MKLKQIGALWINESPKVGRYFKGQIDFGAVGETDIVIFENNKKDDPDSNLPDYAIFLSEKYQDE